MILDIPTVYTGLLYNINNYKHMWRYYYSKRNTTDDYKKFSIAFLRKHWFLEKWVDLRYGTISWSRWDTQTGSIAFWIDKNDADMRWDIRVLFAQTHRDTWEKKDFDYKIPIIATECHYGWLRWWFIDPCSKDEKKCLILYWQSNGYFASRKTLNLAYESQNESKFGRKLSYLMGMNATKAIVLQRTIKYPYRNGSPTKKMRRFLKLSYNNPTTEEIQNMEQLLFRR